ncbi:MAG TPA: tetratricopeptide repeat protein, partial [Polyangia bacterium]|nr:tetratricopeptide repeat protein [Polyangia bacterium]
MGIIERIAGTLDELTGDGDAAAREEVALASAQAERGDVAAAEARLRDVASRYPRLGAAPLELGRVLMARGALEEAVTAFGRATNLDAESAASWTALGDALARLGRGEPAREALRRALALAMDPTLRGRALAALGRVGLDAGQTAKAARDLAKAVELLGDDPETTLAYGRALARLGEREGGEWLTRAARRTGAPATLFIEAAAATRDPALAERLLREGL